MSEGPFRLAMRDSAARVSTLTITSSFQQANYVGQHSSLLMTRGPVSKRSDRDSCSRRGTSSALTSDVAATLDRP